MTIQRSSSFKEDIVLDIEEYKKNNLGIACVGPSQTDLFLTFLKKKGIPWIDGSEIDLNESHWDEFRINTIFKYDTTGIVICQQLLNKDMYKSFEEIYSGSEEFSITLRKIISYKGHYIKIIENKNKKIFMIVDLDCEREDRPFEATEYLLKKYKTDRDLFEVVQKEIKKLGVIDDYVKIQSSESLRLYVEAHRNEIQTRIDSKDFNGIRTNIRYWLDIFMQYSGVIFKTGDRLVVGNKADRNIYFLGYPERLVCKAIGISEEKISEFVVNKEISDLICLG